MTNAELEQLGRQAKEITANPAWSKIITGMVDDALEMMLNASTDEETIRIKAETRTLLRIQSELETAIANGNIAKADLEEGK